MAKTPARKRQLGKFTPLLLLLIPTAVGDLEPTLGRCCAFGANWAREGQQCATFPAPVLGISTEHQSVCLTAAGICCLRYFRDEQCQKGRQAAQVGQDCVSATGQGGEYYKDCCQGCKLGLVSGSMGMRCSIQLMFGFPWDNMYVQCCNQAARTSSSPSLDFTSEAGVARGNLYPGVTSPAVVPDGEDLCARFPGKLCAHVCVPTPGSYRCQCRAGFTLSVDGKTCIQEAATDRCQVNNPCAHKCRDTGISIECSCNPGYTLAANQRSCEDIDECTEKVDSCDWTSQMCINSMGSFRCVDRHPVCDFGYQFDQDKRSCVDVDECGESRPVCQDRQLCVNTLGSYQCRTHGVTTVTCQPGFTFNTTARACIDINECQEERDICNRKVEECVNTQGDYWCAPLLIPPISTTVATTITTTTTTTKPLNFTIPPAPALPPRPPLPTPQCPSGTSFDKVSLKCTDIDECGSDPCGEGELCRNTQGSYLCQCLPGYSKEEEEEECVDVNECQVDVHSCTENQRCDNTIGSFVCIRIAGCGTGYTLNHNSGQCDDNNECKLNTHNCGQLGPKYHCVNIRGSFRCKRKICPLNHVLSEEGTCSNLTCSIGYMPLNSVCIDVNECVVGGASSPCQRNERCINTIGSYLCRPLLNCGAGYHMNDVGTQCVDIDECQEGTHQCEGTQMCSNRQGGYICQCPSGYRLNHQRQCQDINECESYYGSACSSNAVCVNSPGSFHCNCKGGFKESSSGRSCVDIDECFEVEGMCHHNCINVWGSHQCTCRAGYSLASDNRTCDDIDECEEVRGRGRLCIGNCVNNPGSFSCSCPDGYSLAADGRTCKDINECESGNVCRESSEHCVNTRGGYKCNVISCPQNYIKDTRHKNRCKKETSYCLPGDEACQQQPLSYSFNYLPLVSNLSLPSQGQIDLFTMRGPLWASTTVEFSLELEKATASPGLQPATRDFFYLKRTSFNQAVISLVRPVVGPQEVQLALNMKLYQQGKYSGSAVAKLVIYVSQYDF